MKTKIILAVLMIMAATSAWAQKVPQHNECSDCPRISVSGDAVVHVKPDKIVVNLGIDTWDTDITVAKQKNAETLSRVITAVQEIGIPEDALQTDYLSIDPQWNNLHTNEEKTIVGYFVRNRLTVTLSEVEKIEDLFTSALEAGVNQIYGLHFQSTELKKHREEAREEALKAAKEKAEKMSAVLGQRVGSPIHILEKDIDSWGGFGMAQIQLNDGTGAGGMSPSVVLGKLSIRADVSVTFELMK
jgi:uncharacterized protein